MELVKLFVNATCTNTRGSRGISLWNMPNNVQSDDEAAMLANMQQAGLRALRCGLDINYICGNYPVALKKGNSSSPHTGTNSIINDSTSININKILLEARGNPQQGTTAHHEIEYTYLNVHSGLSIGSMTGIDIGSLDRWEFFIIGKPLHDVADAESSAQKGQLVLTPAAHSILCCSSHNDTDNKDFDVAVSPSGSDNDDVLLENEKILPCGCIQNAAGCFRIQEKRVPHFEKVVDVEVEDDLDRELHFYQEVMKSSMDVFNFIKGDLLNKVSIYKQKLANDKNISKNLLLGASSTTNSTTEDMVVLSPSSITNGVEVSFREEENLQAFFMRWISDCLKNDFARHVHEADRAQFVFRKINRTNAIEHYVNEQMSDHRRKSEIIADGSCEISSSSPVNSGSAAVTHRYSRYSSFTSPAVSSPMSTSGSSTSSSGSGSSNFVSKIRTLTQKQSLRDRTHAKHERALKNDSGLNGELRNVIVLFIAIHGEPDLHQPLPHRSNLPSEDVNFSAPKCFNFTNAESFYNNAALSNDITAQSRDKKLLAHYLSCIDVIMKALKEQGGQLRQFIVDDKGTVSIGTFGLRGSTNVDNAAAAIEAAIHIIRGLQSLGLNSSIGITAGSAYCGLVGSLRRHEYAVMGPSVNLSARLMGQAKKGEILCDVSIRKQDRSHNFQAAGEVQAKGFAAPVPIFKPASTRASIFTDADAITSAASSAVVAAAASHGGGAFLAPMSPVMRQYSDGGREQPASGIRGQSSGGAATMPNGARDMHLFGRDTEIDRIFSFLYESLRLNQETQENNNNSNNIVTLMQSTEEIANSPANVPEVQFDYTKPTRGVSLDGSSGIGKSAILEYFVQISRKLTSEHNANISSFFHSCSSLDSRDPYKSWKSILRHMFARVSRLFPLFSASSDDREKSTLNGNEFNRERLRSRWLRGATQLAQALPPAMQSLLPLLSVAHIIPGIAETPEITALSGADRLKKLGELLEALIIQYPVLTKSLVMILLDDVHLADVQSMLLFINLVKEGQGINFIISWNLDLEKSLAEDQRLVIEENMKWYEQCQSSDKMMDIPILPLSLVSLKAMVSGVLLQEGVIVQNDEIFQRLANITGGNPLYAYELARAVVDKYNSLLTPIETSEKPDSKNENQNKDAAEDVGADEVMLEIIDSFKAHRVEEVIFYRLDRLEPKTQMLLKLASVACASGASKGFSLEMIATMLKGRYNAFGGDFLDQLVDVFYEAEESRRIMRSLAVLVKSLVASGEFLKIVHDRNRASFSSEEKSLDLNLADTSNIGSNKNQDEDTTIMDDLLMLRPEVVLNESEEDKIYDEYKELYFDFKIGLERNMIYELMLEDQKESLHDRVANFLEANNESREARNVLSANDLLEEAFHWERAKVWTNALTCYYRAAARLESLGAFTGSYRYYAAGFRCFTNLQKTMGENLLSMLDCEDPVRLVSLMMRVPHQGLEKLITVEECNDYVVYRHAIYRVVSGDEALLSMIVKTIVKFAQGASTLEKNAQVTLTLYHEALQLIFFTWKHRYLQELYSGNFQKIVATAAAGAPSTETKSEEKCTISSSSEKKQQILLKSTQLNEDEDGNCALMLSDKAQVESFGLPDIQLIFPVLSGMASLYRMRRIPDDEQHNKESLFYDAMVMFATCSSMEKSSGKEASLPKDENSTENVCQLSLSTDHLEHQLQAMCLLHSLALESEKYHEAQSLIDKILPIYDYDRFSSTLVNVYGNDRVPFTIAMHAQLLILLGQLPAATLLLNNLIALVPRVVHLHSMGILAISLSNALMVMGRVEDACFVFHQYYTYEQSKPVDIFSFFRETNPVMATWHRLHTLTLQQAASDLDAKNIINNKNSDNSSSSGSKPCVITMKKFLESDEVMDKIIQKGYFFPPNNATGEKNTTRPLLFDALASFGACLEYVAAEILSMMALARSKYIFEFLLISDADNSINDFASAEEKQAEILKYLQEIPQLLQLAIEYIDLALEIGTLSNKYKFPYLLSVLAKVKIVLQLDAFQTRLQEVKEQHPLVFEHVSFTSDQVYVISVSHKTSSNSQNLQVTIPTNTQWEQSVALLLQEVEANGKKFQMPFMSFAAVILSNVIFGEEESKRINDNETDDTVRKIIVDECTTLEEKKEDFSSSMISSKSLKGEGLPMEFTSTVALAAMQLSGIDMHFVKVLEDSLPHFWCGNFNRKKMKRPTKFDFAAENSNLK